MMLEEQMSDERVISGTVLIHFSLFLFPLFMPNLLKYIKCNHEMVLKKSCH